MSQDQLSGDGLLIRVQRQAHQTEETAALLRAAIGQENTGCVGTSPPVPCRPSLRVRCFLVASQLASLLVGLHVAAFAAAHRLSERTPSPATHAMKFSATVCHALWRGKACHAYRADSGGGAARHGHDGRGSADNARAQLDWARHASLRLVWLLVWDTSLGIMLMVFLWDGADGLAHWLVQEAEHTTVLLSGLINWLMGVPAGLKLNNQLSEFLGRFFLYHIYLWTIYIRLVTPLLAPLLKTIALCGGALGATTTLCLLSDLLCGFIFHTYCFYIYACRLFSVQVVVVASLLRLFAGKKWNVLRRRVDSFQSTSERYLLGTLLFTVVLWLLPTTAVFYVVFAIGRLACLVVHCLLAWLVLLIDHFPLGDVLLRACGLSELVHIDFRVVPRRAIDPSSYVTLRLHVGSCSTAGEDTLMGKHFTVETSTSHSGVERDTSEIDDHSQDEDVLVAYGRPASILTLLRGCPYTTCTTSGFFPRVDVLSIINSLTRGYIIRGPAEPLCCPTPIDSA